MNDIICIPRTMTSWNLHKLNSSFLFNSEERARAYSDDSHNNTFLKTLKLHFQSLAPYTYSFDSVDNSSRLLD